MNETISIQRDDDNLRCLAPPKPIWPVQIAALFCCLILTFVFVQMFSMGYEEWTRYKNPGVAAIFLIVWLALAIPIAMIVFGAYRRQKMLSGIIIENDIVKIYCPELSTCMREFPRNWVIGAYLRASIKMQKIAGMHDRANLHLMLKGNRNALAMINLPADELKRVVDVINSMVITDQHKGFEVVLAQPVTDTMPASSVQQARPCPASVFIQPVTLTDESRRIP